MIITQDESILRAECADVSPDEANDLLKTLEAELDYANKLGKNGVGLAAPQIGIHKKAAIIRAGSNFNLDLVNAKIENAYDPQLFKDEGCLSFPGKTEDTIRYQEIHVVNNLVKPYGFVCTGMLAVIVQHEIDHYNGTLFIDRLAPVVKAKKKKPSPNDPCICGKVNPVTGKPFKYKKCCGKK